MSLIFSVWSVALVIFVLFSTYSKSPESCFNSGAEYPEVNETLEASNMANYADRVRILGVTLSADRLSDDVDITNLTQQIAIYENINTAYLTGSITILDDHELYGILDMSGTERITFSFRAHKDFVDGSRIITKTFIITNIDMKKSNDNTSLMYCDIMEEHGYVDNLINFSKSYTDTGENILTKILRISFF